VPYQDTQFVTTFQISNPPAGAPPGSPGTPMDITGAEFALWIATLDDSGNPDTVLLQLSTDPGGGLYITNASQGLLKMVLTKEQTKNLPLGTLGFDCMRTDVVDPVTSQAEPQRYFGGVMYVRPPVTALQ